MIFGCKNCQHFYARNITATIIFNKILQVFMATSNLNFVLPSRATELCKRVSLDFFRNFPRRRRSRFLIRINNIQPRLNPIFLLKWKKSPQS